MQHDDIEWIKLALSAWAIWVDSGECGALGYPRINLLARDGGRSASTDYIPIGVQQGERMDRLVRQLRAHDSVLWCVLMCAYIGDPRRLQRQRRVMSGQDIARALGMHADVVACKRRQAEAWLAQAARCDRVM